MQLAKLSRLSGCRPARARRIASLSVVSAELSALRARRSLLMSRTLLTGSDNAAWQTRRSEPLRVQRLHQRWSPAVVLADLRDERREIGAATASFIEFGHRRQRRGDAGIELGVGVPQIVLELRPVQVCSLNRPSLGASVGQFPPRPTGAVAVGGQPSGIDITLAQRELYQDRAGGVTVRRQLPRVVEGPGAFGIGTVDAGREIEQDTVGGDRRLSDEVRAKDGDRIVDPAQSLIGRGDVVGAQPILVAATLARDSSIGD